MKNNMPKEDYELFEMIVQSSQAKLQKMLYKILKRHYKNIINTSDYIVAEGDIPVALVAHMDTVFKLPPQKIYYDRQQGVLWSPDGLGADDRAGVFLILKIIQSVKKNKKPTIIFTTDEECGCIGSSALVNEMPKPPCEFKYIIQLDRRGKHDCVFYDDINEKFEEYVEQFGFKTSWGTLSDISIICPVWGISGVNLSVGYEDEHQEIETLHIQYTYLTLTRVLCMLDDIDNAGYFKYEGSPYAAQWWRYDDLIKGRSDYPGWDDDEDWGYPYGKVVKYSNFDNDCYCYKCNKKINKITAIKAKSLLGIPHYFCGQCASTSINWCEECGEAFIPPKDSKWQSVCSDCINKTWEKENETDGKKV